MKPSSDAQKVLFNNHSWPSLLTKGGIATDCQIVLLSKLHLAASLVLQFQIFVSIDKMDTEPQASSKFLSKA